MDPKIYEYDMRRRSFAQLEHQYRDNGTVAWAVFNADQEANREKIVLVKNSDFEYGTLRIRQPCGLRLTENVQFNPNRPATWLDSSDGVTNDRSSAVAIDPNRQLDWMPNSSVTGNSQYFENDVAFAYGLGFFAAIAIECENVVVDLNNHTLEQHREHALQQRFYANIELADQPFIPFQGPSNFGAVLRSARNVIIRNGKIGLASHHGIHGNSCDGVMVENVTFERFEVAAFSLNGSKNVYLRNVTVNGNRQDIPVLATYSAARFIRLFVDRVRSASLSNPALEATVGALNGELDAGFNNVIFGTGSMPALFANPSGLIDGTAYGVLINPRGVAVNGFLSDRGSVKANQTANLIVIDCNVDNIRGRINEIIALERSDGKTVTDTAGALFQFFNGVSTLTGDRYHYGGTSLSRVQVELAKISVANPSVKIFGTLSIDQGLIDWAGDPTMYFRHDGVDGVQLYQANGQPHLVSGQPVKYRVRCNGDSMFHVNKGMMGIRIDGVNRYCFLNCVVSNVENTGPAGSLLAGNYTESHPAQTGAGYGGANTYGVVLSAVNDGEIRNLQVSRVSSSYGSAWGFLAQNESCNTEIERVLVSDVSSGAGTTFDRSAPVFPNQTPNSRGFAIGPGCHRLSYTGVTVEELTNPDGSPFNSPYDIRIGGA